MTIDQTNVIDFAAIDPKTDEATLFLTDHLEWGNDDKGHMLLLQEKINSYVAAMESGEIYELYPKSIGRKLSIRVLGKYPLNEGANDFFDQVRSFLLEAGFKIEFELAS